MEIKRDITHMLEPLIETTREAEKDKYPPNDRLPDSTNPTNLFSNIPSKKDWVCGEAGGRRGGRQQENNGEK